MKCPKCEIEMSIKNPRYQLVNDDTPDKATEMYGVHDLVCRNKACSNHGFVVQTVRNPIKLEKA